MAVIFDFDYEGAKELETNLEDKCMGTVSRSHYNRICNKKDLGDGYFECLDTGYIWRIDEKLDEDEKHYTPVKFKDRSIWMETMICIDPDTTLPFKEKDLKKHCRKYNPEWIALEKMWKEKKNGKKR